MRTPRLIFLAVAALAGALLLGGCSSDQHSSSAPEGTPIKLGDLSYNVVITRYLNPNDTEDMDYLRGAPPLPDNQYYLGVFLQIKNIGDTTHDLPQQLAVTDTEGNRFDSVPLTNPWALQLGTPVPGGQVVPLADSAAGSGPIGGSLVLFLIDQSATESRPLELEIPSASGDLGRIQLDL